MLIRGASAGQDGRVLNKRETRGKTLRKWRLARRSYNHSAALN